MKKLLAITLALMFCLSLLGGCGGSNSPNNDVSSAQATTASSQTTQTSASSSTSSAQTVEESAPEPIEFLIVNPATGVDWELAGTPVGDLFVERTGVNFVCQNSIGDQNEVIALMLASDDLPDIVQGSAGLPMFIEAGKALEITELAETYAPNLTDIYKYDDFWQRFYYSKEDKGRYYLPHFRNIPADVFEVGGWLYLQHDVVIDQGYPEMKYLEQFENAIESYVKKYPTIDGQPTIGMTLMCGDSWNLFLTNPSIYVSGVESAAEWVADRETHEITYHTVLYGEIREYFRWLNGMYNKGLLDKEAFTQTFDEYKAKIATGRVLSISGPGWTFAYDAAVTLRNEGKEERLYGAYPIALKEGVKNSTLGQSRAYPSYAINGSFVTTACKDPERLFEFINYWVTEEAQILRNWGIEGVHYDIVDGKRVFKQEERDKKATDPDYGLKTGIGCIFALPNYENGQKDSSGQYITLSSKDDVIANYSDTDKKVLSAYGAEIWPDLFPQGTEFELRPWPLEHTVMRLPADSDGAIAFARCQDVVVKDVVAAVVAAPGAFDAAWDTFIADMDDAGQGVYVNELTAFIKDLMEVWGMTF